MFIPRVKMSACVAVLVLAAPAGLLAQSIPSPGSAQEASNWQPPVRAQLTVEPTVASGESSQPYLQVQYLDPLEASTVLEPRSLESPYVQPVAPHQVLQAPRIVNPNGQHGKPGTAQIAKSNVVASNPLDPVPHLFHPHAAQVPPAMIPAAAEREVWKSPYSYGYFGASSTRRWTRHHGYRDRDKEWRLR